MHQFSEPTQQWFDGAFPAPTAAQLGAWQAIAAGDHTLVIAPTGSGKTLSAFLWAIDQLARRESAAGRRGTAVLYVSPLKALAVDVERNLRAPLVGIAQTARRLGLPVPEISVGVRSGDTPAPTRRALQRRPPDILITTPESLYLMLTSAARDTLRGVGTVIVDEVHAIAGTKRGAHLALSLARLDLLTAAPAQRIGLSATVRPPEVVGAFLVGSAPITIVAPPASKTFDLSVRVPVADMTTPDPSGTSDQPQSVWPHVDSAIVDLVLRHRSSIVFANSRRLSERLTARLNEEYALRVSAEPDGSAQFVGTGGDLAGSPPLLARAHHGSVSKEQRAVIEDDLKTGRLRCVVATSSLELGIDMGAVDLVVQVQAPPTVASGLQRVGRAGHQVGEISRGVIFPKHRADVVHCTVASLRMQAGQIEKLRVPTHPLDVLAQQTIAACALEPLDVDQWFDTVRTTGSYATLPRSAYEAVLDLLSGRYPSDQFGELRPRVVWDREAATLTGRPGAQRLAVTSGGAIADRGLFGVFMVGEKASRVGELDEEMVYESRVGDVFALGTSSWRIEDITHDRVLVSPAPGVPGQVPFWHGDALGRDAELGAALGAFVRTAGRAIDRAGEAPIDELCAPATDLGRAVHAAGLDGFAIANLVALLRDQAAATGQLPSDKTLVVERFHDELGDWRVVLHSPYGLPVHAPWALAVGARVRERYDVDVAPTACDDGIVVRLPDTTDDPPGAELFAFDADEIEDLVTEQVAGSALFAARFRECAARALLLPRRDPGRRTPLWQQRQRAAQLLDVARGFPDFPILLETMRECLTDVYDLPALRGLLAELARRKVRLVTVATAVASPLANSLLFDYVGEFIYEGDSPLAERRAAALSLDSGLLAELLGRVELRELLDAAVVELTEQQLQRLTPERHAHDTEGLADLLRLLGPLTLAEAQARCDDDPQPWFHDLATAKRALTVSYAGQQWWAAIEDAPRLRDALGVPLPMGTPAAFLEPVPDPLGDLIGRYARTHGPFAVTAAANRFGLGPAVAVTALARLASEKRVVEGEFTPGVVGGEWCDTQVLRRLRRRSLAAAREDVEPVATTVFARFLPAWQHLGTAALTGVDGVATVLEQLAGVPIPASAWESLVLPLRVRDYHPGMLDELMSAGEVLWSGHGAITAKDGWIALHPADRAPATLTPPDEMEFAEIHRKLLHALGASEIDHHAHAPPEPDNAAPKGAFFFRQLSDATELLDDTAVAAALWELVWAGYVSGDTFAPVRALLSGVARSTAAHRTPRRTPRGRTYLPRATLPTRTGPPTVTGRWSLLPQRVADTTIRAHITADSLLERYGVLTRGSVQSEAVAGGFAFAYRVLTEFEDQGRCRRGYFVESLGGAQFATTAAVDRLRSFDTDPAEQTGHAALTLAACDPANPYGAALPWPTTSTSGVDAASSPGGVASVGSTRNARAAGSTGVGHRPGRKAGALVVLVDGEPAVYVERGGKTVLTFTEDPQIRRAAAQSLTAVVHDRHVDALVIDRVDGQPVHGSTFAAFLTAQGFATTPRGLRLRASP